MPKTFEQELSDVIADVEKRCALKLRIAHAEGDFPFGTMSAMNVARAVIADCKNSHGEIHEESLLSEISRIVIALYHSQGRLPLFRDVITGKVHE